MKDNQIQIIMIMNDYFVGMNFNIITITDIL